MHETPTSQSSTPEAIPQQDGRVISPEALVQRNWFDPLSLGLISLYVLEIIVSYDYLRYMLANLAAFELIEIEFWLVLMLFPIGIWGLWRQQKWGWIMSTILLIHRGFLLLLQTTVVSLYMLYDALGVYRSDGYYGDQYVYVPADGLGVSENFLGELLHQSPMALAAVGALIWMMYLKHSTEPLKVTLGQRWATAAVAGSVVFFQMSLFTLMNK